MGLLNYLTFTSLDEDYAHVSERRSTTGTVKQRKPGAVGLVVLAVFGILVATAAVQTSRNAEESASSRASLIEQVNARRAELDERRAFAEQLSRDLAAAQNRNLLATTEGRSVAAQVDRLGVVTGGAVAEGPGIRVVVDDAPGATSEQQQVLDKDLQKLVNGLWQVGAEAISINGQRLTNLSAIRQGGSAITVNYVSLSAPYTISAIGNPREMGARLLDTAGGQTWVSLQSSFGLTFDVNTEDSMKLPAAKRLTLRHATQPEPRR